MTRDELLIKAKPVLFNTEMVQAILDGRKTETRRIVKPHYRDDEIGFFVITNAVDCSFNRVVKYDEWENDFDEKGQERIVNPPYNAGDILYVRETWNINNMDIEDNEITFEYRASEAEVEDCTLTVSVSDEIYDKYAYGMAENMPEWRPSIHMPKEAARIFLKVTGVRVERLQDITEEGAKAEGIHERYVGMGESGFAVAQNSNSFYDCAKGAYAELWNSTIPKKNRELYGWDANPWVWVIEFERISDNG